MKILLVTLTVLISSDSHVNNTIAKARQSTYTLRFLKFEEENFHDVTRVTMITRILRVAPPWRDFVELGVRAQLQTTLQTRLSRPRPGSRTIICHYR